MKPSDDYALARVKPVGAQPTRHEEERKCVRKAIVD